MLPPLESWQIATLLTIACTYFAYMGYLAWNKLIDTVTILACAAIIGEVSKDNYEELNMMLTIVKKGMNND